MPPPNGPVQVGANGSVSTDGADIAVVLKTFLRNVSTRDVGRAYRLGEFCDEPVKTSRFHERKRWGEAGK